MGLFGENDPDPSADQKIEDIRAYYSAVSVGDKACFRQTFGGMLDFTMTSIRRGVERGAVITAHAPAYGGTRWWVKSGKNSWAPGGQFGLVVPTQEIEEWLVRNRGGSFNWRTEAQRQHLDRVIDEMFRPKSGRDR